MNFSYQLKRWILGYFHTCGTNVGQIT